jgi:AAA family ATP:ADP antiporter
VNGVTAFFVSNLVVFYVLGRMNVPIAVPFFIWVGLFNVMLIAQVWAFANDLYTQEQGKRLLAITGIGSSLGAILGADLAGRLFKPLGSYPMMLVAASLLVVCMAFTVVIHRREKSRQDPWAQQHVDDPPAGDRGGVQLVFRYRYLLLIAGMVLLANLVNTTGEFILGKSVKQSAEALVDGTGVTQEEFIGKFYARFFFWVNVLGAAFQLFLVSRIMKYLDAGAALMFLPIIALGSYTLLAFMPVLSLVRTVKILENGTDYSIQNTARHSLFLSTGRDAKYKAKTAIDNFFWRAGDAFSALLVFVGTQFALGLRGFAIANIVLVCVWLAIAVAIFRERRKQQQPEAPVSVAA